MADSRGLLTLMFCVLWISPFGAAGQSADCLGGSIAADSLASLLAREQFTADNMEDYLDEFVNESSDSCFSCLKEKVLKKQALMWKHCATEVTSTTHGPRGCARTYRFWTVCTSVPSVYVLAISDVGNLFLLHGFGKGRWFDLAMYLYGENRSKEAQQKIVEIYLQSFNYQPSTIDLLRSDSNTYGAKAHVVLESDEKCTVVLDYLSESLNFEWGFVD